MKKNLRIVSAAAAALLAVAPVAASAVNVNAADVVVPGGNVTDRPDTTDVTKQLWFSSNIGNSELAKAGFNGFVDLHNFNMKDFLSESSIKKNLSVASNNVTHSNGKDTTEVNKSENPQIVGANAAKITEKQSGGQAVHSMKAGQTYYLQVQVTVNGLSKNTNDVYSTNANTEDVSTKPAGTHTEFNPSNQGTVRNLKVAVRIHAYDSSKAGQPFFKSGSNKAYNNGQTVEAPKLKFNTKNPTDADVKAAKLKALQDMKLVSYKSSSNSEDSINYTSALNSSNFEDYQNEVAAGTDRTAVNSFAGFDKAGSTYTIKRVNLETGKLSTLHVFFKVNHTNPEYPLIRYSQDAKKNFNRVMQGDDNFNNAMPIAVVQRGDLNWAEKLVKHFKAEESSNNTSTLPLTTQNLSVSGGLNIYSEGLYHATITATNSNGLTTTLKFRVAVSGEGKDTMANYFVTGSANEVVKLVSIVDGKVSNQYGTVVNQGQPIVVYPEDTTTVDGVEYTRVYVNGKTRTEGNQWIPTKNLQAAQPKEEAKTSVKIMHSAKVYNEKHEATGKENKHAYNSVEVVANEDGTPKKFTIGKDVPAYKLADGSGYIDSRNVEATPKKLTHNAYVYKSNGKARTYKKTVKKGKKHVKVTRKVLKKKGTTQKTYGAPFNIKGHKMYRIGVNQYIKVANFGE